MSEPIMQKLDEMQARCDAATEGPWEAEGSQVRRIDSLVAAVRDHSVSERRPDAEFIAASRTHMPLLINALKAVLEEHYPVGEESDCRCCPQECACGVWEYPCVTVKVLAKAMEVES